MPNTLSIKNMVCNRCITAVEEELNVLNIPIKSIALGEVQLEYELDIHTKDILKENLEKLGFELLENKKRQLTEKVKNLIVDPIHHQESHLNINLSDYISQKLDMDYITISKYFSELEHVTIEKYIIAQKIERAKELISYNELTMSEIANKLHYSSIAHLSNQFKKITGNTPSEFKNQTIKNRKSLSDI